MQQFVIDRGSASFSERRPRLGAELAEIGTLPFTSKAMPMLIPMPDYSPAHFYKAAIEAHGALFQIVNAYPTNSLVKLADIGRAMGTNRRDQAEAEVADLWQHIAAQAAWLDEASARIRYRGAKPDGWKGEGSVGPTENAVNDALALVERLQAEAPSAAPMISLDEDGEFIFFWRSEDVVASATIAGDDSFTFYGKRKGRPEVLEEGLRLADPLLGKLISILVGSQEQGAQA